MRHLLAATALAALASTAANAAGPQLTPAQRQATHAMFEHIINTPTVIGRHKVPEMAQFVADQFKAGGFPAEDVHVIPYHTESATTGADDTAAVIVRWRAAGTPKAKPILLLGHMDVVEAKREDSTEGGAVIHHEHANHCRARRVRSRFTVSISTSSIAFIAEA